MPVVSNTSPLLNLAIIGELDLIRHQFGVVWVPSAVVEELRLDNDLPGTSALRAAFASSWLQMKEVRNPHFVTALQHELDRGEAEALVLATEVQAERILLDEREGRRAAHRLNIPVTGVLGVLLRARKTGQLQSLRKMMDRLRAEAGFWIDARLEQGLLKAAGEISV